MSNDIFVNIGDLLLIINCILFIKGFSTNGKTFKIFTLYCVAMFAVQMVSRITGKMHINNLFLSHFYFILQFIILSFFYYYLLKENFQKRIISICFVVCLALLFIHYAVDWSLFYQFSLFEIFITSLPLLIYATFHLYNLLNKEKEFYYINIGLLIYLFGSTIVFLSGNLLLSLHSTFAFNVIIELNVYLYIVYQLFILYELVTVYGIKNSKKLL